jgi:hypothetical protein
MPGPAKVIPFPSARRSASSEPSFAEVRRCRDQGEALVVRSLLESEGIVVILRSNLAPSVYPFSVGDQGAVTVLVRGGDAARARQILARP